MQQVTIIHQSRLSNAPSVAEALADVVTQHGSKPTVYSTWNELLSDHLPNKTDLAITVGGDGTLLRMARIMAERGVPVIGVNMGRIGFTTELSAEEAVEKLPLFLKGQGWIEERTMLSATMGDYSGNALNEVVISRNGPARIVHCVIRVNDQVITSYRGDGALIASATGSTGYSLSNGGPVLEPKSKAIIVKPINPHVSLNTPLIIEDDATINVQVQTDHGATLTLDGNEDENLTTASDVYVKRSNLTARFLRLRSKDYFYTVAANLLSRAVPVPPTHNQ
ncbi:NAD(+)/NADH kinase [Dehalococcoidia bacterium]|nr:NAD(+)/NADH kinase [Dehalococcoidia bacterium]